METSPLNQGPIFENTFLNSKFLNPDYLFYKGVVFFHRVIDYAYNPDTIALFHTIIFILAIFFLTIISYASVRMFEIRRKEHRHLQHEIAEYAHHKKEHEKKAEQREEVSKNPRWIKTLDYLFSQHPSDWKLAVIEADSMLESLMDQLGFKGENLGDKLKSATQETFRNLTAAWEVHTIRNRIAHESSSFDLSQREAKRVIATYEQIFRDYGFI